MFNRLLLGLSVLAISLSSCGDTAPKNSSYIDPTIGNVVPYLVPTYPTMQRPNQMLRMFPVKADYISDELIGLPLQVTAHRQRGIFQLKASSSADVAWGKPMIIDHDLESYAPWFYSTYLIEENIRISFAPASKGAIYNFDFAQASGNAIRIGASPQAKIEVEGNLVELTEKISYTVKGLAGHTRTMSAYIYGELSAVPTAVKKEGAAAVMSFDEDNVEFRYAVSYIDIEQAKENFTRESLGSVEFDQLVAQSRKSWDEVMDQIEVEGGSEEQKRTFFTSLYRTYERMVDINEYGRYFSGYDYKIHQSERPFYVDDWIWDTYRAQHPMRTILTPTMEEDMLHSYVQMYEQSGWLPTFPQVHGNHLCMNSYHSAAILLDGYRKGLRNFDVEAAYAAIKKNLTESTFIPWRQHAAPTSLDEFYYREGYFPALALGEAESEAEVDSFEKRQAVAVSLGVSYDFWTLKEFAKDLGKEDDYKKYSRYATDYKKLWDSEQQLFIPKDSRGNFVEINAKKDGGKGYREYYDENNGWTYAWDVPHDVDGLIELLGGKESAEKRLDQLFREPLDMPKAEFVWNGANSTGMVGQFSMGNEPSFHIPYLYNYFGAPWKTQQKTRFMLDVWFKDNIFGVPGDEDGGGMTAFVVMSSLGIYPVTPGEPIYTITSPIFEKSSIALENGKIFTVEAKGASKKNKYIQAAKINGEPIDAPFISHEQIMSGATLTLELGELPNREWGKSEYKF
ncbi:MAG: GH92 family glycosyl hydrolase [Rikenellaceae bacterium]